MADKTQFLSPEQLADNRNLFLAILETKVKRDGVEDLIAYLEDSDFFTAPSSTRFHGNYEGGLCEHSLNVYNCLMDLHQKYEKFEYTDETLAIASTPNSRPSAKTQTAAGSSTCRTSSTKYFRAATERSHASSFSSS